MGKVANKANVVPLKVGIMEQRTLKQRSYEEHMSFNNNKNKLEKKSKLAKTTKRKIVENEEIYTHI